MRTLDGQNVPNILPPSTDFPYGRAKNSSPPSQRNGTPVQEENLLTDLPYALMAVMKYAGIVPNEDAENINTSQFLDALLSMFGAKGKVVVDAPDLVITDINELCGFASPVDITNYNTWLGVCSEAGKLVLSGEVNVKIRNRTGGPVVATKGSFVYAGDVGLYSAGFIDTSTEDNTALLYVNNVIGELAQDTVFGDTTSYIVTKIILRSKPMLSSGGGGFWFEDGTEQTLLPNQPGIAFEPISIEWDSDSIKNQNRVIMSEDIVIFKPSDLTQELIIYQNLAINDLSQLVTTNGLDGASFSISPSGMVFTLYELGGALPAPGDLVSLTRTWDFTRDGFLFAGSSIVLADNIYASHLDGEVWYNSGLDKLQGKDNGTEFDLRSVGSGVDIFGFNVTNNQLQTISTGVFIRVWFGTENLDEGSNWSTLNDEYVNGATAAYISFSASVEITISAPCLVAIGMFLNASQQGGQEVYFSQTGTYVIHISEGVKLAPSDIITVGIYQNSGFNATVQNSNQTKYSGHKINQP